MEPHDQPHLERRTNDELREAIECLKEFSEDPWIIRLFGPETNLIWNRYDNDGERHRKVVLANVLRLAIFNNGDQLVCIVPHGSNESIYGIIKLTDGQFYQFDITQLARRCNAASLIYARNTFNNILEQRKLEQQAIKQQRPS